jgi:maleylpyruvate isomerase
VKPTEWVAHAKAAHASLLGDIGALDDTAARASSLLPGWSRGHVLTHVARNADSTTRIFRGAQQGDVVDQYPGGSEQRSGDIDAGAGRSAAELIDDVTTACGGLEAAWDDTDDDVWEHGRGRSRGGGEIALAEWVLGRWREVEVHHADLDVGFGWADWSSALVREELRRAVMRYRADQPMGATELPAAALALRPKERLAWLFGRTRPAGLPEAPPWM